MTTNESMQESNNLVRKNCYMQKSEVFDLIILKLDQKYKIFLKIQKYNFQKNVVILKILVIYI